jgi:uncharacterized glyoxalase superfamily protein PhnB
MITGVEMDWVVPDAPAALALYEKIFDGLTRLEVSAYPRGLNEAVFTLYGTRLHLLDANPEYGLTGPQGASSMWLNIAVPDIQGTYGRALAAGCAEVQPVTNMPDLGVQNAVFADPYGYTWMLHQIDREISYEERCKILEAQIEGLKNVE